MFIVFKAGEVFGVPRIGQFIDVDDAQLRIEFPFEADEVGSDEAATACHEDGFHRSLSPQ